MHPDTHTQHHPEPSIHFEAPASNILDSAKATAERIHELGGYVSVTGKGWTIQCPHPDHADTNPSASMIAGERGQAVLRCYACAGSNSPAWIAEVSQRLAHGEMFVPAKPRTRPSSPSRAQGSQVAEYVYVGPKGRRYFKTRYVTDAGTKSFDWSREYAGSRTTGLGRTPGTALLPYGHERLTDNGPVYWVEGEKDADRLHSLGVNAVTSALGAAGALPEDLSSLEGRSVIVIADRDEAGGAYALRVKDALTGIAHEVRLAQPAVTDKKGADVSDHLDAGHGLDDLDYGRQQSAQTEDVTEAASPRLQLVNFADMPERTIQWLVPDLIPEAEVVVALGQEGIGKGLWWGHLIGQVTTGPEAIDVLVIVAEDSPDATVLPRLKAVGANLSRVHLVTLDAETLTGVPTIPGHGPELEGLIAQVDAKLVIVDPWLSVVPGGLQVRDTQQARQALDPVTRLARNTKASFVLVTHTNRTVSTKARELYGATVALRQAGRVCVMALQDPMEDDVLYVGVEKSNIMRAAPATKYRKVGANGSAAWRLETTGEHVGLTIAELVDLFAQAEDGRATDRWTEVAVAAAESGGLITRAQVVAIYADASDPAKAADKAIARWRNTEPPRLSPVRGERGVYEVAGIGKPPATPHHPYKSDTGGKGGATPRTPRETNMGAAGGSGGFDTPDPALMAATDPWAVTA